jgi:phosphate-selective porin OprO and OprP
MRRLPNPLSRLTVAAAFLSMLFVRPVLSDEGPVPQAEKAKDTEKAKEAETDDEKPAKVSYKKNAATFESERLVIRLNNRVQFRLTDEIPDPSIRLSGTAAAGDSRASFRVRRAKTSLEGWFFRPEFKFDLQLSWAGPEPGASAQTALEDALITWDASKKETFQVTFGQFKVPLGRQEMTSSSRLQFADRDIFSFEFSRGRDLGLEFNGMLSKKRLSYMLGVFNGNAASRLGNDNSKFQYNARVMFEPWGAVGYSEGDFESKDKPLLAVAGQFEQNNLAYTSNVSDNLKTTIWGADVVFKYKGFSLWAEYLARDRKPQPSGSVEPGQSPFPTVAFNSNGWHGQAGYFLKRDVFEVAMRYATYDPTDRTANNDRTEVGGALNYFINKHFLKLQADFRQLEDKAQKTKNKELRIQSQVMF